MAVRANKSALARIGVLAVVTQSHSRTTARRASFAVHENARLPIGCLRRRVYLGNDRHGAALVVNTLERMLAWIECAMCVVCIVVVLAMLLWWFALPLSYP